jgi:hypothetical protein
MLRGAHSFHPFPQPPVPPPAARLCRAFFLYVLQALPAATMLPLALRFPRRPELLLAAGALLRCLLHPRPQPGMVALWVVSAARLLPGCLPAVSTSSHAVTWWLHLLLPRQQLAAAANAHLFVTIHCNALRLAAGLAAAGGAAGEGRDGPALAGTGHGGSAAAERSDPGGGWRLARGI